MRVRTSQRPGKSSRQRLMLGLGVLGVAALGYCLGRAVSPPLAMALPPEPGRQTAGPETSSDYANRVVATIYGNVNISREELGEYLIARYGADRLELLVNKRIIDHECKERGIEVTAAEIDIALREDMASIHVNQKEFIDSVLAKYRKTLYEWKEDVIRPRLLLDKICRDQVHSTDEDLEHAFQAHYGEKVECRIILWPQDMAKIVTNQLYGKIRESEEEFDRAARTQPSPSLAARGGRTQPFGHYSTGDEAMEKAAFRLQPGEISEVIGTPQGLLVIKCDRRIPADPTAKITDEKTRSVLEKEVIDKKVQLAIPEQFKKMQKKADPKMFMKPVTTEGELAREVIENLHSTAPSGGAVPRKPENQ